MSAVIDFPVTGAPMQPALALPQNIEAEQAVLGALLMNNAIWPSIATIVEADHFAEEIHRRVFGAIASMIAAGQNASPVTLRSYLPEHDIGGLPTSQYLALLARESLPPVVAIGYAKHVRDLALRRALIIEAEDLAAKARDAGPGDNPIELAAASIGVLQEVAGAHRGEDTRRDAGASAASIIARARAIKAGEIRDRGISTGLKELDLHTGGFQPGTLWIVAGRPGMGKTLLATGFGKKIAQRAARDAQDGLEVAGAMLFSLEVPETQLTARILADLAFNPRHPMTFGEIMRGQLEDEQLWALDDAQKRLERMPLTLDVAPGLSVQEIAARVRAETLRMSKRGFRLGVVLIDYLKFVKASDRYRGNRVYEVGEISGALKQLSKELDLCIVLLAQLNRALEARDKKDKRPILSDLRDSGDLEADADVVAFIHREAYYIKQSAEYRNNEADAQLRYGDEKHKAEIIIGKSRVGETKTIDLWCDMGASTFAEQARGGI